jgi:hypothetical protein
MSAIVEPQRCDLMPATATWRCPMCGHQPFDGVPLEEDEAGCWAVPVQDRYIRCDECDALLDIGWNGWRYFDAAEEGR